MRAANEIRSLEPAGSDSSYVLCSRNRNGEPCSKGRDGGPDRGVELVGDRWFCRGHAPAAKAVASKRRDHGYGQCSVSGCDRPAAAPGGKCQEHRAGERAAGAPILVIEDGSGRGDHPYAPKRAEIYVAVFPGHGVLKVGKATPWTVRNRVSAAAGKLRIREAASGQQSSVAVGPTAWAIPLFGDSNVLWAVTERIEHAVAGRLAYNVGAASVDHNEGKEWLRHDAIEGVDWEVEFYRAACETLTFLGHRESDAGTPRRV